MCRSKFLGCLADLFVCATILAFVSNTLWAAEDTTKVLPEWRIASQNWESLNSILEDVEIPRTIIFEMNVRVYSDPDIDMSSFHTYSIDYTNLDNRLLEKELFKMVETVFSEGKASPQLVRSDENPEILITMDFYTGKKEEYVPPATVITTRVENVWSSSSFGWGGYTAVPITESHTTQGYTTVSYYRNIRLNFLDFKQLSGGEELEVPPLIWVGEVESEGYSSDIRIIAPVVLNQLLMEFPKKSGRDMTKRRQLKTTYGRIGISVDSEDRRIIVGVDPDSPAERAGLKSGDKLLTINKEKVSKSPKTVGDIIEAPYFKYVISNAENKRVSFVVKSAERKKKYRVEITPIIKSQEWYLK